MVQYPDTEGHVEDFTHLVEEAHANGVGTVKPVLAGHSKIGKAKALKTHGSLMKVESIAECSLGAFCNTFDLH